MDATHGYLGDVPGGSAYWMVAGRPDELGFSLSKIESPDLFDSLAISAHPVPWCLLTGFLAKTCILSVVP